MIKIISGGQTGADQGGLLAARDLGWETGGTAPYNWMTEKGPAEALLRSFGLVAGPHDPNTYPIRTALNAKNSDVTIWFGTKNSPGVDLEGGYSVMTPQNRDLLRDMLKKLLDSAKRQIPISGYLIKEAEVLLDKYPGHYCPVCGALASISCRCMAGCCVCPNGHDWFMCVGCCRTTIGKHDHKNGLALCGECKEKDV